MSERILEAIRLITEETEEHGKELQNHDERLDTLEKIVEQQAKEINQLEEQMTNLRNQTIRAAIERGVPSNVVAQAHGLSAGRISQIAPRRKH